MHLSSKKLPILSGVLLVASLSWATNPDAKGHSSHPEAKTHKPTRKAKGHKPHKPRKPRGQQAIDHERAREIQEALIREHYLNGGPSGNWDLATQQAMQRYQQDQGWSSKTVPDSRALIRLGLGPDHGHLLNPESAMTTGPVLPHSSLRPGALSSSPEPPSTAADGGRQTGESSSPVSSSATGTADLSPSR
jgi:peptidoglycan hydrolase-like protein with peptidoglycan-binding domain